VQRLAASGVEVHDIGLERPTLDEVFALLTGDPAEVPAHDTMRLETAAS